MGKADSLSPLPQTTPPKCLDCRQYLDDPDLKFFQGDPDDAVRDPNPPSPSSGKAGMSINPVLVFFSPPNPAGGAGDADGRALVHLRRQRGRLRELRGPPPAQSHLLQVRPRGNSLWNSLWNLGPHPPCPPGSVYDKRGHLCPFDTGLIERNIELYFSGVVKPIYDDNPCLDGEETPGIPGDFGIPTWELSGFFFFFLAWQVG